MNENRLEGSLHDMKGAAKEAIGKAVGNASLRREGKAEHLAGKAQKALGVASDTLRAAVGKR